MIVTIEGSFFENGLTFRVSHLLLLCTTTPERKGRRPRCSQDPIRILGTVAEPTGTDGFRLLCHQFFPSSLPRLANCISRCNACLLKRNQLREALLLL